MSGSSSVVCKIVIFLHFINMTDVLTIFEMQNVNFKCAVYWTQYSKDC